jgi:hypothetical protein
MRWTVTVAACVYTTVLIPVDSLRPRALGKPSRILWNNIKMGLREIEWGELIGLIWLMIEVSGRL